MAQNIFIIGYYGSQNIGDELLLESTIQLIREQDSKSTIRVLTYSIEETEQRYGVVGVSRNDYKAILRAIKWCDALVGGGGSMLQNVTSNRSLAYYLSLLFIAQAQKKKVVLLGNGVGPISGRFYKIMTFAVLKRLTKIVLRDEESYQLLKSQGMTNIVLGADLAFNLKYDHQKTEKSKLILLNLRPWKSSLEPEDWVPQFISYWQNKGYSIGLLAMQKRKDDVLLRRFESESVHCYTLENANALIQQLKKAEVVVAMRLHALIFSAMSETPFVGIGYDPKIMSFLKNTQQTMACSTEEMQLKAIVDSVEEVINNKDTYEQNLATSMQLMAPRILENQKALDFLKLFIN